MSETPQQLPLCPGCSAPRSVHQPRCWLCGDTSSPQAPGATKSLTEVVALRESRSPITFGLDTLLLTVTLVAVCLGLGAFSPTLGILLAIVAGPAYIRTLVVVARRKQTGGESGVAGKIEVFFVSLTVMFAVAIAALVAFVSTCFPIGLLGVGVADSTAPGAGMAVIVVAFAVGFAAAGLVAWLLLRWTKHIR